MSSQPKPLSVLAIDDDESFLRFVRQLLKQNGYHAATAADGLEGLDAALDLKPDLIILDLTLPGASGLEVCARLREWYRGPILVLSGHGDEAWIVQALDRGADDYITKPFRPAELLARMRALVRRVGSGSDSEVEIVVGGITIDLARRRVIRDDEEIRLTRTEFDILAFLARHADCVATSEMILREVWGPHHGEYAQTLRVHIGHIRKKIEPDPAAPSYILTEPGVGYRFTAPTA